LGKGRIVLAITALLAFTARSWERFACSGGSTGPRSRTLVHIWDICIAWIVNSLRLRTLISFGDGFMGNDSAIAAIEHRSRFRREEIFRTVTAPIFAKAVKGEVTPRCAKALFALFHAPL